jgi:hypothetical protein
MVISGAASDRQDVDGIQGRWALMSCLANSWQCLASALGIFQTGDTSMPMGRPKLNWCSAKPKKRS